MHASMEYESPSKLHNDIGLSPMKNSQLKSSNTVSSYDISDKSGNVITLRGMSSPLKENGNKVL